MKEVVVIWDKMFLGGGSDQITVTHLTVLLTSKEGLPAAIFVQLGSDTG